MVLEITGRAFAQGLFKGPAGILALAMLLLWLVLTPLSASGMDEEETIDEMAERARSDIRAQASPPARVPDRKPSPDAFLPASIQSLAPRAAGLYESVYYYRGFSSGGMPLAAPGADRAFTVLPGHVWLHGFNPFTASLSEGQGVPTIRNSAEVGYQGNQDWRTGLHLGLWDGASLEGDFRFVRGPFSRSQDATKAAILARHQWLITPSTQLNTLLQLSRIGGNDPGWIPRRVVRTESDRFRSTEGSALLGSQNVLVTTEFRKQLAALEFGASVYGGAHDFHSFFNPTFYLLDVVNGDQKEYREQRAIYGGRALVAFSESGRETRMRTELALSADIQRAEAEVNSSRLQTVIAPFGQSTANYQKLALRLHQDIAWTSWLQTKAGVALEQTGIVAVSRAPLGSSAANRNGGASLGISPEVAVTFLLDKKLSLMLTSHVENQARDYRAIGDDDATITPVIHYEAKLAVKPVKSVHSELGFYGFRRGKEPLYDFGSGLVAVVPERNNLGVEWKTDWQALPWLRLRGLLLFQSSKYLSEYAGGTSVPSVPSQMASLETKAQFSRSWAGSLNARYVGPRPLSADGYYQGRAFVLGDVAVSYDTPTWGVGIGIENFLNTQWNEVEKVMLTKLQNENGSASCPSSTKAIYNNGDFVGCEDVLIRPGLPFRIVAHAVVHF